MAASNRFYSAPCKTYRDDTTRGNRIRWYIAPEGAVFYPHLHAFTPGIDRLDDTPDGLMEFVAKRTNERSHNAGSNLWATTGEHWHGDEEDFLGRAPRAKHWIDGVPPENPCGGVERTVCRFVLGHVGFIFPYDDTNAGGCEIGGYSWDPTSYCRFLIGGSTAHAPPSEYTSVAGCELGGVIGDGGVVGLGKVGGGVELGGSIFDPDADVVEVITSGLVVGGSTTEGGVVGLGRVGGGVELGGVISEGGTLGLGRVGGGIELGGVIGEGSGEDLGRVGGGIELGGVIGDGGIVGIGKVGGGVELGGAISDGGGGEVSGGVELGGVISDGGGGEVGGGIEITGTTEPAGGGGGGDTPGASCPEALEIELGVENSYEDLDAGQYWWFIDLPAGLYHVTVTQTAGDVGEWETDTGPCESLSVLLGTFTSGCHQFTLDSSTRVTFIADFDAGGLDFTLLVDVGDCP